MNHMELLRTLEWGMQRIEADDSTSNYCPSCGASESDGHGDGCELQASLAQTRQEREMIKVKHTPGTWHSHGTAVWSGAKLVAVVYGDDPNCKPDGRMKANAHLIAAAPELLNALTVLADVAERKGIPCDAARAAIAKATGEQPK
jgi:hypothetical protein